MSKESYYSSAVLAGEEDNFETFLLGPDQAGHLTSELHSSGLPSLY